jgi:hypothetical protein
MSPARRASTYHSRAAGHNRGLDQDQAESRSWSDFLLSMIFSENRVPLFGIML